MDTLLLTVYFLVVIYVLYQMALSLEDKLEDKVVIDLDRDFTKEQTQSQLSSQPFGKNIIASVEDMGFGKEKKVKRPILTLTFDDTKPMPRYLPDAEALRKIGLSEQQIEDMGKDRISIEVLPIGKRTLKQSILVLSIDVKNKTEDSQVYLDWDRSSLEMFGQGNRIIRSTANMARDLSQPQIFGTINPGQSVRFDVNIERNYTRDPTTGLLKQPLPVVDLKQRVDQSQLTDPTKKEENIQALYGLDLMVRFKRTSEPDNKMINLLVPFAFTLKIEVDQPAFPPLRWLLRNIGRRNRPEGSWFWGTKVQR
jgi:hypothetical protein